MTFKYKNPCPSLEEYHHNLKHTISQTYIKHDNKAFRIVIKNNLHPTIPTDDIKK